MLIINTFTFKNAAEKGNKTDPVFVPSLILSSSLLFLNLTQTKNQMLQLYQKTTGGRLQNIEVIID